jgi:hypothetical protein
MTMFAAIGWIALGLVAGVGGAVAFGRRKGRRRGAVPVADMLAQHFDPLDLMELNISGREFPLHVRADLNRSIERLWS